MMGKRSETKPCEAIKGIISEGEETIDDFGQSPAIDAGLLLNETLQEEVKADKLLTQIGATKADKKAA
jgi:ferritin-like metal-binding protein YciE